jgi:hypothetical protein
VTDQAPFAVGHPTATAETSNEVAPECSNRARTALRGSDRLTENHSINFRQEVGETKKARPCLAANMTSFATDTGGSSGFKEIGDEIPRFQPPR